MEILNVTSETSRAIFSMMSLSQTTDDRCGNSAMMVFATAKSRVVSSMKDYNIYAAYVDGSPVGFILFSPKGNGLSIRIDSLFVAEKYRKKGIANKLVDFVLDYAEGSTISLSVYKHKKQSVIFWEKQFKFKKCKSKEKGEICFATNKNCKKPYLQYEPSEDHFRDVYNSALKSGLTQ